MTNWKEKYRQFLDSSKRGWADMKAVFAEGNYKLFVKQFVFIVLIILAYRYVNNKLNEKDTQILGQINAAQAQQDNEQEYLINKKKLLELEPRFPDIETKNDWLLRQIVEIFRDSPLTPKVGSSQTENTSNNGYTTVQIPVELTASYGDFARLLADLENKEEYLRVTEFSLDKSNENLGQNGIKMKIETIFPKEKIGKNMFKNTDTGTTTNKTARKGGRK